MTRRGFLQCSAFCGLGLLARRVCAVSLPKKERLAARQKASTVLKEAAFWEPAGDGKTRCLTCPNRCEIGEGENTRCQTRTNRRGRLHTMTYGNPCVVNVDALEKNPLYHVDPGAMAIGVATAGCNLRCTYCQNWDISQVGPSQTTNMDLTPEQLVAKAKERQLRWLTFSYTEPVAYLEYALDSAKLAKQAGLKVAVVTAGVINPRPLADLMNYSDAFSVTLKGATREFYRDVCGADPDDVWRTLRTLAASKCWLEVVTLIVPRLNDREEDLQFLARGVAQLGRQIPIHFLRFVPAYKLKQLPPTPVATLERARETARRAGLKYVYIDLPGHRAANTTCPDCAKVLIERVGLTVLANRLRGSRCPQCGAVIPGRFN